MSAHINSPAPRTEHLARRLAWVTGILAVVFVLSVVYTIHVKAVGADFTRKKVDCINTTLGVRAKFTDEDNANETQKIKDQTQAQRDQNAGAAKLLTAKTPAEGQAAFALFTKGQNEFLRALSDWQTRHDAIDGERKKVPLGAC